MSGHDTKRREYVHEWPGYRLGWYEDFLGDRVYGWYELCDERDRRACEAADPDGESCRCRP